MIRRFESFSSLREMYEYFASAYGVRDLEKYGFKNHWRSMFGSPVAFLHMALPADERNDFLFHYYDFQYWFNDEVKKKKSVITPVVTEESEDSADKAEEIK